MCYIFKEILTSYYYYYYDWPQRLSIEVNVGAVQVWQVIMGGEENRRIKEKYITVHGAIATVKGKKLLVNKII